MFLNFMHYREVKILQLRTEHVEFRYFHMHLSFSIAIQNFYIRNIGKKTIEHSFDEQLGCRKL